MKLQIAVVLLFSFLFLFVDLQAQKANEVSHNRHSYGSIGYADSINSGTIAKDTMKGSVHRTTMVTIKNCHIHIEYGSPGVKNRVIWGGLVPYDEVWVTGAHSATSVSFSKAVRIGGKTIEAGTYALFTIPGKNKWIVIFNTNVKQHLADDYKQSEDLLRIELNAIPHSMTQRLTYAVEQSNDKGGVIKILWEKLEIALPFEVAGT